MAKNFNLYAQYYNLLYQDKAYAEEVDYIESLLSEYASANIVNVLDLGCGTGRHDILLSQKGYHMTGVDLSSEMIDIATSTSEGKPNTEFVLGDVRTIKLKRKFDAVISLFHVASYQVENSDFKNYLETAYNHLDVGGLFIFDFWYGPGVLTDKPTSRTKAFENQLLKVMRTSKPRLYPNNNSVDVDFDVQIYNKGDASTKTINETHKMRYLFLPEILNFADQIGFSVLDTFEWMTNEDLSLESWYGVVVLKKIK